MNINNCSLGVGKMEEIQKFVEAIKVKFGKYLLAYGLEKVKNKTFVNIIIDDRDIRKTTKEELTRKLDVMTNSMLFDLLAKEKSREKIEAKINLLSDLNQETVWEALGDSATIVDVKSMINFIKTNLPFGFFDAYDKLSEKFKLEDLKREYEHIFGRQYHRNTYQNWLKSLKKSKLIELKGKYYNKIFRGP